MVELRLPNCNFFDEVTVNWLCTGFETFWLIEISFSFILFASDAKVFMI
jgi:hypothetical protein